MTWAGAVSRRPAVPRPPRRSAGTWSTSANSRRDCRRHWFENDRLQETFADLYGRRHEDAAEGHAGAQREAGGDRANEGHDTLDRRNAQDPVDHRKPGQERQQRGDRPDDGRQSLPVRERLPDSADGDRRRRRGEQRGLGCNARRDAGDPRQRADEEDGRQESGPDPVAVGEEAADECGRHDLDGGALGSGAQLAESQPRPAERDTDLDGEGGADPDGRSEEKRLGEPGRAGDDRLVDEVAHARDEARRRQEAKDAAGDHEPAVHRDADGDHDDPEERGQEGRSEGLEERGQARAFEHVHDRADQNGDRERDDRVQVLPPKSTELAAAVAPDAASIVSRRVGRRARSSARRFGSAAAASTCSRAIRSASSAASASRA